MTTYHQLRDLSLPALETAVETWRTAASRMEALHEEATTGLAAQAREATWQGETARTARPRIHRVRTQLHHGHLQARATHRLLEDFVEAMRGYQRRLEEVRQNASAAGLRIQEDGSLTPDLTYEFGAAPHQIDSQMLLVSETLRGELERVLAECAHTDEVVTRALYEIAGEQRDTFGNPGGSGLDGALREDAQRDAAEVLRILENDELTAQDLARLEELIAEHQDEEFFAARVVSELGPSGLVEFWTHLENGTGPGAIRWDSGEERTQRLAGLQEHMGVMLGSATRSEAAVMGEWEEDVLALAGTDARAFQVVSALMHHGDYESAFLMEYGDALIDFEQDRGNGGLWEAASPGADFNFLSEEDTGSDPMTGFLEAMGRNPEAATQYFAPPGGFDPESAWTESMEDEPGAGEAPDMNSRLLYLATEREWSGGEDGPDESLGHALVAAATGRAFGEAPMPDGSGITDLRTRDTADVMEQVVYLYGTRNPELLSEQPEMGASLGAMTAAYIDDAQFLIGGVGAQENPVAGETFPRPYEDGLGNGRHGMLRFLSVIGQSEDAHGLAVQAQHVYVLSNLDAHPPTSEQNVALGHQALMTGAEVRGILDHSRSEQITAEFGAESAEAQEARARAGSWLKAGTNLLIGAGVGAVAAPATGGASIFIPLAAGAGGAVVSEMAGQGIDAAMQMEDNHLALGQAHAWNIYGQGEDDLGAALAMYMAGGDYSPTYVESLFADIKESYRGGRQDDDEMAHDPYVD